MKAADIASYLDFANHHPNATSGDIKRLCQGVVRYGFNSAFVNQSHVALAKKILGGRARVGTVVSFPLGQDALEAKLKAVGCCVRDGADELDVVPNLGLSVERKYEEFLAEMRGVVKTAKKSKGVIVKFIIEPGYLDSKGIRKFAELIVASGADFVKVGSGMGPRNPTVDDVEIVKKAVHRRVRIKVAGGISTYSKAVEFIEAGADRIGTSHAIDIIEGSKGKPRRGEWHEDNFKKSSQEKLTKPFPRTPRPRWRLRSGRAVRPSANGGVRKFPTD